MSAEPKHLVSLLTRPECHLCEAARDVVRRVATDLEVEWEEVSIAGNESLSGQYGEEIPVVLVDGVQRDFWQIDENRLRRLLSR